MDVFLRQLITPVFGGIHKPRGQLRGARGGSYQMTTLPDNPYFVKAATKEVAGARGLKFI